MGTQLTKNEPKSHKFTKPKNWARQIHQQIQIKTRFTNTLRALLITRRLLCTRLYQYVLKSENYNLSNRTIQKEICMIKYK